MNSYKNCQPEIAASLKKGIHVRCRCHKVASNVSVSNESTRLIVAFIEDKDLDYYMDENGNGVDLAEPLKTQTRVICHEDMMKGLLKRGYEPDQRGDWICSNEVSKYIFSRSAWICCCMHPDEEFGWEGWMLEEVEI